MTLTPCADVSAAAWIESSDLPWQQLVVLGPSGFEAYARLRFLPDPTDRGQSEGAPAADAPSEHELLRSALDVLSQHTRIPDDCYFCLWDGWGVGLNGPTVKVPNRAYFLFRGKLSEFGDWGVANSSPERPQDHTPPPAFVWPADHAWCVANDVDSHFAGIGADSAAIDQLRAHPQLDLALTDPQIDPPRYE